MPEGLSPDEIAAVRLIPRGRANAIPMAALAGALCMTTRNLQDVIKNLIEVRGVLVCSSCGKNHGFYLPESIEDYERGRNQIIHRIKSLASRLRAIDKQAYEEIFGQERIL